MVETYEGDFYETLLCKGGIHVIIMMGCIGMKLQRLPCLLLVCVCVVFLNVPC